MYEGVRAGRTVRDTLARARGKEKTQTGPPWASASPGGLGSFLGGGREDQAQSTAKREAGESPVKPGRKGPRPRRWKEGPHSPSQGRRSSRPSEASALRGNGAAAGWRAAQTSLPDSARRAAAAPPGLGRGWTDPALVISRQHPRRLPRLLHRRLFTSKTTKGTSSSIKNDQPRMETKPSESHRELQRTLQASDAWTK